ncbi:flagellar hook-associated protein [Salinisphaera dokdonensis CL-ES53]|uniref:Flagellar hook-associated protein 1 n=1 Tax=Salinisphaera dokdonensis CL-ES53 TaxID=1304272 RepID=A0ABV2AZQ5_9GAMM
MSNLFGIGLSGLGAAQTGLSTTSNNISNVNTAGYSRQTTSLSTTLAGSGQGGVRVTGVERQYQQYLTSQLNDAKSSSSALDTHLGQISQINNLLGDSEAGLAPLMQQFFAGLQTLAASPADPAARESMLGDANNMSAQFRAFSEYLGDMQESVASQMGGAVDQINNYAAQIANLNTQIVQTEAKTGQTPNNLLDQRDSLVSAMGELVDVKVSVQDGNSYQVTVAGQPMVDANGAKSLKLVNSSDDPTRKAVAFETGGGRLRELSEDSIRGGTLGGLLAFSSDSLEPAQQRLDQLAHTLAARVNEVHQSGKDLKGNDGQAFFGVASPASYGDADNLGTATLNAQFVDGESADVRASDYEIAYRGDSNQYEVTRLSDGDKQVFDGGDMPLTFGGMTVDVDGAPQDGDSFRLKPLARAAASFEVEIKNTSLIAAGQADGGTGDNRNALALAGLQSESSVDGDTSFNSSYARLVSDIGNKTRSLQVNSSAQERLTSELETAQQSVSGVNLDEERVNLLYYQQMYQANARVIETAASLFDSLLGIRA